MDTENLYSYSYNSQYNSYTSDSKLIHKFFKFSHTTTPGCLSGPILGAGSVNIKSKNEKIILIKIK